jgi:hypothetical protein
MSFEPVITTFGRLGSLNVATRHARTKAPATIIAVPPRKSFALRSLGKMRRSASTYT